MVSSLIDSVDLIFYRPMGLVAAEAVMFTGSLRVVQRINYSFRKLYRRKMLEIASESASNQ